MNLSAPKVALKEQHESIESVNRKAQALANEIKKSKHFIVFTGAGVSTSAGIPDFRGPEGAWTLRAQGRERTGKPIDTLQAIPTPTHMALVELQNRGYLKYLVSQNCDGLHRRSGILPDNISELHGNNNREYCRNCAKEYIRDFRTTRVKYENTITDHRTGRKCTLCTGPLLDTIIEFGENLPAGPLATARFHAGKADLCLVLGSSLTVAPASSIPELVGERKGARLAISNLQSTPLDELCATRVHAKTDELMIRVMAKLDLPIPEFTLHRKLIVELEASQLTVRGVDYDGTPVSFLRSVKLEYNRRVVRAEPFVIAIRGGLEMGTSLKIELEFMGHYGEPNLDIVHEFRGEETSQNLYLLDYNPGNGIWRTTRRSGLDGM